jgi:type IV pilus assembly protein PilO
MAHDFQRRKSFLLVGLAAIVLADIVLIAYALDAAASRRSPERELAAQTTEIKLLRADVERAREIRKEIPQTRSDCDQFEGALPPARTFYSAINSEMASIGKQSGLLVSSIDFRTSNLAAHGMTEVSVDAKVTGNYTSVVRFLNGVQRSKNYYIVDSLALSKDISAATIAPDAPGVVSVDLHLKSYFKGST